MFNIVRCGVLAMGLAMVSACQTPENPFQTMADTPPAAQQAPPPASLPLQPWRAVDASTGQITDVDALEALAEDFPGSSSVRLRLINALIAAERWQDALGIAEQLSAEGYEFSPAARDVLIGIVQTGVIPPWLAIGPVSHFPIERSDVISQTPANIRLPEAALYDAATDRLFVSSVVSQALYVQDGPGEGAWQEVAIRDAGSISGIAMDERRGLIWVASSVFDQTPSPQGAFRGAIAIDRNSLEVRRLLPVPDGVTISDIAVGPDGSVYASDPVNGMLWVGGPTNSSMAVLIDQGTFRSPQGIAVRPDGRSLFVSDYRYGLAVVTLPSRQVYRVQSESPALLDGVDGMWLYGNELIVMQNGINPHRLTAFQLGGGIGSISGQRAIERDHSAWTEPLGGAVSAGMLTYIGTGQWDIYGDAGALNDSNQPRPGQIRQTSLMPILPETAQ